MSATRHSLAELETFHPRHNSFVGVDSDGCVFPTMDVKQKNHFHPLIIRYWGLEPVARHLRAAAEFVNLYSRWRGKNRYPNLLLTFELLADWDEVRAAGVRLPDLTALRAYCHSGLPLGHPSLRAEVARTRDPELQRLLDWSLAVSEDIDRNMRPAPPFPWALRALEKMQPHSDLIVVSQTPVDALVKEWTCHGMEHLVRLIAGQELGSKTEQLRLATRARYPASRVLMIGDAPGDLVAAQENQADFFPILPGHENDAWQRFHEEAYDRFLRGAYAGPYADRLIQTFQDSLSDTPPWRKPRA